MITIDLTTGDVTTVLTVRDLDPETVRCAVDRAMGRGYVRLAFYRINNTLSVGLPRFLLTALVCTPEDNAKILGSIKAFIN